MSSPLARSRRGEQPLARGLEAGRRDERAGVEQGAHLPLGLGEGAAETLELLGEYLHARGMEVLTAYAPEEAVALARSVPIDVVFVELAEGGVTLGCLHLPIVNNVQEIELRRGRV